MIVFKIKVLQYIYVVMNKQSRQQFLALVNFITCLPPLKNQCAFILSVLKRVQRWQEAWLRSGRLNAVTESTKKVLKIFMEHQNSPPPAQLYNGPRLSWSEPTIEFHDKNFIAELKVKSSDSVTDMPNFRLLISPVRFFGKKKGNTKNNNNNGKQTNKQAKVILTVCFIWFLDINIYRLSTLQRWVNVIDTDISKNTMLLLIAMNITYRITTKLIYYNNRVTFLVLFDNNWIGTILFLFLHWVQK